MIANAHTTWRRNKDAFTFSGILPVRGSVAATMAAFASSILARVRTIGVPMNASLSTLEHGDNAAEWRLDSADVTTIVDAISAYSSASSLMIDCNIVGEDSNGERFTIDGLPLLTWVERPDLSAPPVPEPSALELTIMLDVDLFAARSWAADRDNCRLAAINAPRFNAFLDALCSDLGGRIVNVDAPSYEGEVTIHGFTAGDPNFFQNATDQIDLTCVSASTEATRGPAGKQGFSESLGITADDLSALIEDLIRHELAARQAGGTP